MIKFWKAEDFLKKVEALGKLFEFLKKESFDEKNKCFPKKLLREQVEFPVAWKVRS